jgi:hypothetical protein
MTPEAMPLTDGGGTLFGVPKSVKQGWQHNSLWIHFAGSNWRAINGLEFHLCALYSTRVRACPHHVSVSMEHGGTRIYAWHMPMITPCAQGVVY